jgi:hypothetical protein
MRDFAERAGLRRQDLPPAPDQDDADASWVLCIERRHKEGVVTLVAYEAPIAVSNSPHHVRRVNRTWLELNQELHHTGQFNIGGTG